MRQQQRVARFLLSLCALAVAALCAGGPAAYAQDAAPSLTPEVPPLAAEMPQVALQGVPFEIEAQSLGLLDDAALYDVRVRSGEGAARRVEMFPAEVGEDGRTLSATVELGGEPSAEVAFVARGETLARSQVRIIPGWWSLLPPLVAITLALAVRRVVPALFFGVLFGSVIAAGFTATGVAAGLFATLQTYVLGALIDEGHAAIIIFSLMIGGMVGIISKNAGTQGLVDQISKLASTPRRGQTATGLLGVAIFFDDYANTLVVGNTMRPVTDRLRISREKLAYIVDSTAAPMACLALVTTWVGYEVGLIENATQGIDGLSMGAYNIFLGSIAYSFYPILALFFVFAICATDREFGPMLHAERRARRTGKVLGEGAKVDEAAEGEGSELAPKPGIPARWFNAVVPVFVLVAGVLAGLYITGTGETLQEIIGSADSFAALMGASLVGVLVAGVLSVGQRLLTLEETVEAWYAGLKAMLFAMIVLVLAWALSGVTDVLHTGPYLADKLGTWLVPGVLPALVFLLAAATAFATGSSWGTMGILMPLIVPLAWSVLAENGMADPEHYHILYSAVSCVLAGAVWGDHCSPISDTTILSSMASGCDHIEHVRTQLPYALGVGAVALLLGTLPAGFGAPPWLILPAGAAVLVGLLFTVGTPLGADLEEGEQAAPRGQASAEDPVVERPATTSS